MDTGNIIFATDTTVHEPQAHVLDPATRAAHVLIFGTSPTYKRGLIKNLIWQDMQAGVGVAVLDVTGQFSADLLDCVPKSRTNDTLYFKPNDPKHAPGFNPFRNVPEAQRARSAQEIMELFREIWKLDYERTPLLLDILRATARVLLDSPNASFLSMYQLLQDTEFRKQAVAGCTDLIAVGFWNEFHKRPAREQREKMESTLTRLRAFVSDPVLRATVGQIKAPLDIERVVQSGQVFLADLSERELGSETSMLLGSLLTARFRIALGAYTGTKPFHIYIPDCHRIGAGVCARLYSNPEVAGSVTLSTDQVGSITPEVRSALLQAQTLLAFRLSVDDVRYAGSRFLLAQNETSLQTLPPERLAVSHHQYELNAALRWFESSGRSKLIVERSRKTISVRRTTIDRKIERFLTPKAERERVLEMAHSDVVVHGQFKVGDVVSIAAYKQPVTVVTVTKATVVVRRKGGSLVRHPR